jgi:hypothetical protein
LVCIDPATPPKDNGNMPNPDDPGGGVGGPKATPAGSGSRLAGGAFSNVIALNGIAMAYV